MIGACDIILAGVGGQGTLVAGKLLGQVAISSGLDVKVSEVHGMAQRGGSVVTYVRTGLPDQGAVADPQVEPGTADLILAFEELEALRWAHLLRQGGLLVINRQRIVPLTVAMGKADYPADTAGQLRRVIAGRARICAIDALDLARRSGSPRAVNIVMIGAAIQLLNWPVDVFAEAISTIFPARLQAMNQTALQAGIHAACADVDLL